MKLLFVDTAGWMASVDASDPAHKKTAIARDKWLEEAGFLLTTDYIADETLTLIRRRMGLGAAEAWWQRVEGSSYLRWELIDVKRADKARDLFFRSQDKAFSFTDCTSFVVMRELKMIEVLTTDHHFRQMGFQVLP